jgi:hypothetical protein
VLPYRLDPVTRQRILDALRNGCTLSSAAEYAGIGRRTLYDWISAGEKDGADSEIKDFALDVRKARAGSEVKLTVLMHRHASKNWKAALALLRVINPKDWIFRDPAKEEEQERLLHELRELHAKALASGIFSGAVNFEQPLSEPPPTGSGPSSAERSDPSSPPVESA